MTTTSEGEFRARFLRGSRPETLAVLAALCLALVLRLGPLERGFGEDELYTVSNFVDGAAIEQIVSNIGTFNNHIGYSLMARAAESVFGRSERVIRLPALLLGLGALYVFWLFSKGLLGTGPAVLGTLWLAVSPRHIGWSTEARGYSGMVLLTLASSYLFLKLLRKPSTRHAAAYVFATALGTYVHMYSFLTFAVQVLFLSHVVLRWRRGGDHDASVSQSSVTMLARAFILTGVLVFLLYLPALRDVLATIVSQGRGSFRPGFPWQVLEFLYGGEWLLGALLAAGLAGVGCLHLARSRPLATRYCLWLLVGPLLTLWLISPRNLYTRFFAYWLPYYLVFIVAGLVSLWRIAPRPKLQGAQHLARALALAITGFFVVDWVGTIPSYAADEGYRGATSRLLAGADDSVSFCAIGGSRSMWRYYVRRPIATPRSVAELRELGRSHPEVRCLYYEAWWQDEEQTEMARFLLQHAAWARANETTTLFWFREPG